MNDVALKAVRYLRHQRITEGQDDLQTGKQARLEAKVQEWLAPYEADPTLVHRESAAKFMYNKLYQKAVAVSWEAVCKQPQRIINWRTLAYCWRKRLFAA